MWTLHDIPLAHFMDKNLEAEARWALEILDPNIKFKTLKRECDWAANLLNPKTQIDTISSIDVYKGQKNAKARRMAVEDACVIASNAMDFFLKKESAIFDTLAAEIGEEKAREIIETADSIAMFELRKGAARK